ncbi:MAG: hypothetical protein C0404_10315 [Verrucomicrobia bacterium]|nr:hypothetical protein [Verrucomicrobiota bacterium]
MLIRIDFFLPAGDTKNEQTMKAIFFFVLFVLAASLCGFAMIYLMNRLGLFDKISRDTKLGGLIWKIYDPFRLCFNSVGLVLKTVSLSLVNHASFILCAFFVGKALEINLKLGSYFTVFPLINTVASLPITPGGLGTRDAACVFMLGVGSSPGHSCPAWGPFIVPDALAMSLSVSLFCAILFWGLVGGIVYIHYAYTMGKAGKPTPPPTDISKQ